MSAVRSERGERGETRRDAEAMCVYEKLTYGARCHSSDDEAEETFVRDWGFGDGRKVSHAILFSPLHTGAPHPFFPFSLFLTPLPRTPHP